MSTAAGIAVGLAASSAAQSACSSGPMTPDEKTALAVWVIGLVIAWVAGAVFSAIVQRDFDKWDFDFGDCFITGLGLAGIWAVAAPIATLIWVSFDWLFLGGG